MTIQELIQDHVKEECRYCTLEKCNGINVTNDNRTRCDRNEG